MLDNPVLYIACYDDPDAAGDDYKALRAIPGFPMLGAVVVHRDGEGKVKVHETGAEVAAGSTLGAAAGLVVGLFAPPLLLSFVVGGAAGGVIGELVKKHEERKLGVDLEEIMPPDTSAVVAVLEDREADKADKALAKATKKLKKAVDKGDAEKLEKALAES